MGGEDVPGERSSDPQELLPLTPVALNILLALADAERHGYGMMVEVRERTGGRVRLGPGTLYGAIKRLKEGGVIEECGEERPAVFGSCAARSWRKAAAWVWRRCGSHPAGVALHRTQGEEHYVE